MQLDNKVKYFGLAICASFLYMKQQHLFSIWAGLHSVCLKLNCKVVSLQFTYDPDNECNYAKRSLVQNEAITTN